MKTLKNKKDKILIEKVKQCLDKANFIIDNNREIETHNDRDSVERLLSKMAFDILVDINGKRNKETKRELIEELSDALEVDLFDM